MNLTQFWDWIDKREIDKHAVSVVVMYGTVSITRWAMAFANAHGAEPQESLGVAAVIAAVSAPYMAMQAAAISFYFKARSTPT